MTVPDGGHCLGGERRAGDRRRAVFAGELPFDETVLGEDTAPAPEERAPVAEPATV